MNRTRKLSMCEGKDQLTCETARKIAAAMRKRRRTAINWYKCKVCGAYHVGGK